MSGLITVTYFLISTGFGLVSFILWLRFGLRYFRISQVHPIHQMILRLTAPIFKPLYKTLQIHLTSFQRYDWVCFTLIVGIEWCKFLVISLLYFGHTRIWVITGAYTLASLIILPCDLLFYAVLIRVIMSWVNPHWQHPLASLLYGVTEPLLQKIRRHIPNVSGIDFSPFAMLIGLKVITLFLSSSLPFKLF